MHLLMSLYPFLSSFVSPGVSCSTECSELALWCISCHRCQTLLQSVRPNFITAAAKAVAQLSSSPAIKTVVGEINLISTHYNQHICYMASMCITLRSVTVSTVGILQGWIADRNLYCGRNCSILLYSPHSCVDWVWSSCCLPIPGTGDLQTVAIDSKVSAQC